MTTIADAIDVYVLLEEIEKLKERVSALESAQTTRIVRPRVDFRDAVLAFVKGLPGVRMTVSTVAQSVEFEISDSKLRQTLAALAESGLIGTDKATKKERVYFKL